MQKDIADFNNFKALDIRVGTIVSVEDTETKKPTYRITVDFGEELGTKVSCAGYRSYEKTDLLGKQVVAVINLGVKQIGLERSEILILGAEGKEGRPIYITPESAVSLGSQVF